MLRLSQEEKERLQKVADELGINCAQLASFYPPGRQSGLWQADADYRVCGVILCRKRRASLESLLVKLADERNRVTAKGASGSNSCEPDLGGRAGR
jgi:hypothetical protein